MIHTKEQANVFHVYLTAYRSTNTHEVNEILTNGLVKRISAFPGQYGSLVDSGVQGCFKEAGQQVATIERTLLVRCTKLSQVAELTDLACLGYDQDAVLQVNSQTHTAILNSIEWQGEYPNRYPQVKESVIGVFTKQDTGSEMYSIINGERWEVA